MLLLNLVPAVRKGAFEAGQNANFNGKILYPKCRMPVYTPSDWDPALAARSAELPSSRLVLEYVYGYQGMPSGIPSSIFLDWIVTHHSVRQHEPCVLAAMSFWHESLNSQQPRKSKYTSLDISVALSLVDGAVES